jgi:hypothetical protein
MMSILTAVILTTSIAVGNMPLAEVEKAYWDCEFAATKGVITPPQAAACSQIYEYLKKEKFMGDFDRLFAWWRQNKERELSSRMTRNQFQPNQ